MGKAVRKKSNICICRSLPLLPACTNFPLANSAVSCTLPQMKPVFSTSPFAVSLFSPFHRDMASSYREPQCPTVSEQALCPGGCSTLQLGNRQLKGEFNGHLQQVGSKHFYCALEALHIHVTAQYSLKAYISVNKSHFPSRKKQAFSCTLLHKLWSSYLLSQLKL